MDPLERCKPVKLFFRHFVPDRFDPNLSPIIFLHGIGSKHSSWKGTRAHIAEQTQREVYTIDLRNHGQSEWSENNSIYDYASDLENFLKQNGISKCILVGHSLGAKIAMFYALKKPQRVEKIIVEEATLANPSDKMKQHMLTLILAMKNIRLLPKGMSETEVREFLSEIIERKYPGQSDLGFFAPLRRDYDGTFQFDFNIDVIERSFRDGSAYEIDMGECFKFDGPALVLYGETAPAKVEDDKLLREFFPNSSLCKWKTRAHCLHTDRPEEFAKKVSSFINM